MSDISLYKLKSIFIEQAYKSRFFCKFAQETSRQETDGQSHSTYYRHIQLEDMFREIRETF